MDYTPIEQHGDIWLKRDDTFTFAGIGGGKVRACRHLARNATRGLVTASARKSPQMQIVARIAHAMGLPCRCHTASGPYTMEMTDAARHGAELVQHRPGYNSVICSRAERDVALRDWTYIPFGMEHNEAMGCTRLEVGSLFNGDPIPFKRIVICLGSGMSAAGVLHGLRYSSRGHKVPVLGVRIGADPTKRLDGFAPMGWRNQMKVVTSRHDYTDHVDARVDGVLLDPHYEAKCAEYLQPGDLFWIVGIRAGLA